VPVARTHSIALVGVEGHPVEIETDIENGLPGLLLVGLPDTALRFINTEPVNLFFRSRSDLFIEEFVEATPEPLRSKTVMEITEKSIIDDFEHFRDAVARLRAHGFRIAIDDAGAGYSGLRTVVEAEPDFIKLDISLIRGLDGSHVKQKLVKTLHDFAGEAGITLIAEGVETDEQLTTLRRLDIPYGQGFLFAYPGSPYPLQERIEPGHAVRSDEEPVELADYGVILNRKAQIGQDPLRERPVVVPAALVLILLDSCARNRFPAEMSHGLDDGLAVRFGDIHQHAVHVEHEHVRGYHSDSSSVRNLRICSRVPMVTRTQPGIS